MKPASRAHGVHGSGSRDFEPAQFEAVWRCLEQATGDLRVDDLASSTGVPGRTVRAILSEGDGVRALLAGGDDGYHIARDADDAEGLTRRLESQARKMAARAALRRAYTRGLPPPRQGAFF